MGYPMIWKIGNAILELLAGAVIAIVLGFAFGLLG